MSTKRAKPVWLYIGGTRYGSLAGGSQFGGPMAGPTATLLEAPVGFLPVVDAEKFVADKIASRKKRRRGRKVEGQ